MYKVTLMICNVFTKYNSSKQYVTKRWRLLKKHTIHKWSATIESQLNRYSILFENMCKTNPFYFPPCKPLTKSGLTKCQRFTVDHLLFLLLFYTHNPRKILPFYSLTPNGNETKLSKNKNTIRISSKNQPSLVCCVSGVTPGAECIMGYACAGVDCSFPALAVNVPFGERTTSER